MSFERFVARRYLRSKQQMRFINIIMMISLIGITVGVAALIIVLSVFNGFNSVVTQVLVGFDPHLRVESLEGSFTSLTEQEMALLRREPEVRAFAPFISSKALILSGRFNKVVLLKGVVDSTIDAVSGVGKRTVLGEFRFDDTPGMAGIVLGLALADRLGATVGSEVTVVSPVGVDAMLMQFGQPLMKKCRVVGIYDSNNKDYDAHYAFISLDAARQLFRTGDAVSGIDLRLSDIDLSENVQQSLSQKLGERFRISTWYDLHKDLYSVMRIERWSAYVILCLIVGVATFNMLGSLTMGVIEKKRDIGVLKSMGATKRSILRIFMFEGMFVGTLGTVAGIVLGTVVCYLQLEYNLFPLDPGVYIIPALPVEIRLHDFFSVGIASMLLSTCAALYPALRASRLLPIEAIRWE